MYSSIQKINFARRVALDGLVTSSVIKNYREIRNFSEKQKNEDRTMQEKKSEDIYFSEFLKTRLQEASRSLVVKAVNKNACTALGNLCSSFGKVSKMFHYEINSQNFILVEMSHQDEVKEILRAQKNNKTAAYSLFPFQWEFGFYSTNNKNCFKEIEIDVTYNCHLKAKNFRTILKEHLKDTFEQSLSAKIINIYHEMKLNDLGIRLRFLICKQFQRMIQGIMADTTVHPFGSSVNGFGVNGCDLDLVILQYDTEGEIVSKPFVNIERRLMQSQLEIIADVTKFFMQGVSHVFYIRNARVPIVKFKHSFTGVDCDLSMYCNSGVKMSQILFTLINVNESIKPLVFIIRLWAKNMAIIQEQPNHSITNFSLILLIIFFLQQKSSGRLLPSLHSFPINNEILLCENDIKSVLSMFKSSQKTPSNSIENLLLLFFRFYSTFDFQKCGCCVSSGKIIEKVDSSPLYIKNPLNPELNVSINVSLASLIKFQDFTVLAQEILENKFNSFGISSHSVLLNFLNVNTYNKLMGSKTKSLDISKIFGQNSVTEIKIGDVRKNIKPAKNPQYTPHGYLSMGKLSQNTLKHLRWMLQKDLLKQDMFLIGHPGPNRRQLVFSFLEMTGREVEYVSLSRDTTEADLKQRREILGGTAKYFDQNAVRAAMEGRVLVLEGIEKAERNVLPVLNNLLENREMHLEDGRFLMPAWRYDKLLKDHSKEDLDKWNLVRVSDDFRIIALGLPVPKYFGNPLDPPLRSRFQARNISHSTFQEQFTSLKDVVPDEEIEKLSQLLSCGHALVSDNSLILGLPEFPIENLPKLACILQKFPSAETFDLLCRLYPYNAFSQREAKEAFQHVLKSFHVKEHPTTGNVLTEVKCSLNQNVAICNLSLNSKNLEVSVPCGSQKTEVSVKYIPTNFQENLIVELLQSHSVSDFCLVGPKGCGKSTTIYRLANLLNYEVESIVLYQDITSRDLIQQRTTLTNGDTIWKNSPLIQAALDGKLAILKGIDQIHPNSLSVIHSLVHDRDIQLYDGKRLVRHDRYEEIKRKHNLTDEDMASSQILKVHPSFRLVAVADFLKKGVTPTKWLSAELLSLFLFHEMRPLSYAEEKHIIQKLFGTLNEKVEKLLNFAHFLKKAEDPNLASLNSSFSTRQLLRMSKRLSNYPHDSLYETVQRACLARFLPPITKEVLDNALRQEGIELEKALESENIVCSFNDKTVKIGKTEVNRYETNASSKVPDILFYDIPQHLNLLEWLIQDFTLGEHLLLVGNQGVGKNKIADRLLQLLNRPREYIQLHRDTTVHTLTVQSTVKDGIVSYEDSPLVQAVKLGHVLIIDEADKAPTHVTCILKTLIERNEMTLSDGRKIIPPKHNGKSNPNIIEMHPDFRIIVLANRPGFPFLGNDFFGALGDLFSCHTVDNPSTESEISLLKQYGPDVPENTILSLVKAFGELREMADKGLVQYPYSTREVINIVKHLQNFPDESITDVVSNVFDFDKYSSNVTEIIFPILKKHGIPINCSKKNISLSKEYSLPKITNYGKWSLKKSSLNKEEFTTIKDIKISKKQKLATGKTELDIIEARGSRFTELVSYTSLPLPPQSVVLGLTVIPDKDSLTDLIHILAVNPFRLYIASTLTSNVKIISLDSLLPKVTTGIKLKFSLTPLSENLNGTLFIHEENSNDIILVNTSNNTAVQLDPKFTENKILRNIKLVPKWKMNQQLLKKNMAIFYTFRGGGIQVLNLNEMKSYSVQLPIQIKSLHAFSCHKWLIQDYENKYFILSKKKPGDPLPLVIEEISENIISSCRLGSFVDSIDFQLDDEILSKILNKKISSPNRLLITDECYAAVLVGFPDLESSDVYCWPRLEISQRWNGLRGRNVFLSESFQLVSPISKLLVPKELNEQSETSYFLEVLDLKRLTLQYIPVPDSSSWYTDISTLGIFIDKTRKEGLLTVDFNGNIRLWEIGYLQLQRSLDDWQKLIGKEKGPLQLSIERPSGKDVSQPKHGKIDPNNEPHVGGNTWAGGTGGRDTAGLGGKGGPYRLDAGHNVHQIPDFEKSSVPKEVQEAARKMGQQVFKQRLKEIKMSEYDHELYQSFYQPIAQQVKILKNIIENLQAKSKERDWARHQTFGDFDDLKLIEGLTGEKTIYRRRTKREPYPGSPQTKPKRLKLVVDVSGSMYRFNGYDGRLNRILEASVLVMEAFENQEAKFQYDITGHSGEGFDITFVEAGNQPKNNKERLQVVKVHKTRGIMHSHSQFCMSGDHTLPATMHAIDALSKEDCDEAIVIVLSDANLERYGISPISFGRILTSNPDVNAYAIFIGSLGDQATRLASTLPAGRAFVCLDLSNIPHILQQIFTTSLLMSTN